jgi:hypothetical protein
MSNSIKTINLYNEDGIAIYLSEHYDVCSKDEATVRVVGHRLYVSSVEDAENAIRAAYLKHIELADPMEAYHG